MNTTHTIIRFAGNASYVAGGLLVVLGNWQASLTAQLAQLSGQGTTVTPEQVEAIHGSAAMLMQGPVHAAAPVASVAPQLFIGGLFILLGLGLHVLYALRNARNVPVHAAPEIYEREEVHLYQIDAEDL